MLSLSPRIEQHSKPSSRVILNLASPRRSCVQICNAPCSQCLCGFDLSGRQKHHRDTENTEGTEKRASYRRVGTVDLGLAYCSCTFTKTGSALLTPGR